MKCPCVIKVCLLLALWACGIARAEDYVLDFSTKAFSGTYSSIWTWTEQGIEWELDGAYNGGKNALYNFVRFGGHGESNGISYIKSNQPLPIAVKEMVMNVLEVDEEVEEFRLYIAEDPLFENTVEVVKHDAVAGEVSFLPQQDTVWLPDLYYKLEVRWDNPKSGNKVAQVSSLTFKEGVPPPVYTVTAVANDDVAQHKEPRLGVAVVLVRRLVERQNSVHDREAEHIGDAVHAPVLGVERADRLLVGQRDVDLKHVFDAQSRDHRSIEFRKTLLDAAAGKPGLIVKVRAHLLSFAFA